MAKKASIGFDPEIYTRANLSIAHGALTNSKRAECLVKGIYPTHLVRAEGAIVWDTKRNSYIDFITGLGSSILGYAHSEVDSAIIEQLKKGITFSLGSTLEVDLAEKLKEIFSFIERSRFLKTGSDACTGALRIARSATNRTEVLSEGYHGFHDEFVSLTPPAIGVCKHDQISKFMDLEQIGKNTAAVIVEPVITDHSSQRINFLRDLRKKCSQVGALLIFDEVITGFRFPKFSVSNYYGIEPDLICLGKAIGNGMPLSVIGGKKEVMECGEYFISSTFAGETLSLAAALKTIDILQKKESLDHLWEKGAYFIKHFNAIWSEGIKIEGYPARGVFKAEPLNRALFFQEACRAGVLFGPSFFFNFSHIEHIDTVLSTIKDILIRIKAGNVKLEGEMPATPFAQKMRNSA